MSFAAGNRFAALLPAAFNPTINPIITPLPPTFTPMPHTRPPQAKELATTALARLDAFNRRTLDAIAARIYFYLSWAHERSGGLSALRPTLLRLHRTAVLRHDAVGQETLLNLLLRSYLADNLYDQAEALRAKAHRPEALRTSQQHCRWGRVVLTFFCMVL
jgi:hypothetical protein